MHRWVAICFAGCAFQHGTESPLHGEQIVDDTAGDFAPGAREDIAIDSLGFLAPDAFVRNGLHARAYGVPAVTATSTYAALLQTDLGPLIGERFGDPPTSWGGYPLNLGLGPAGRFDNFTILYDGELYLPEGPTTLQIAADDVAVVELDLGAIRPSLHPAVTDPQGQTITVVAPRAGWYPLHAALTDTAGNASLLFSAVEANTAKLLPPERFRCRVTDAQGVIVTAGDRIFANLYAGSSAEPQLLDHDWSGYQVPRYEFQNVGGQNYGLRYAGQFRVETKDLYIFSFDLGTPSTVYARLFVDGKQVAGNWPGGVGRLTGDPVELAPGWHDIIVDYSQLGVTAKLELLASTPAQPPLPLPADRLRPVKRSGYQASFNSQSGSYLTDAPNASTPGVTQIPLAPIAPSDAVADFVDLFFFLGNVQRNEISVAIGQAAKVDTATPLPAAPALENYWDWVTARTEHAGAPAASGWTAVYTDSVPSGGFQGYANSLWFSVTYHGGPNQPFARVMTFTSAPRETPGATSIDGVHVTSALGGGSLQIELRTGDASTIESAPWVTVADGDPPGVTADALLQYRLKITGDGWQYPTVDRVEIDYTAR